MLKQGVMGEKNILTPTTPHSLNDRSCKNVITAIFNDQLSRVRTLYKLCNLVAVHACGVLLKKQ